MGTMRRRVISLSGLTNVSCNDPYLINNNFPINKIKTLIFSVYLLFEALNNARYYWLRIQITNLFFQECIYE